MPLRNERQAYWDDIEENIALAPALSASARLARVCPEAAAAQAELRSRLHDLEIDIRATELARDRSHSLSAVAARERDAAAAAEEKRVELERAEAFVRGRLEGDRVHGRRPAFTRPEDLPRAGLGQARRMGALGGPGQADSRLRHHPGVVAQAQREANERWGAAETGGVLMGGGYTFVLERQRRDAEDARRRAENAARERALYFEPPEEDHDDTTTTGRYDRTGRYGKENGDENVEATTIRRGSYDGGGVGDALKGWPTRSTDAREVELDADDESELPPPRYGAASGASSAIGAERASHSSHLVVIIRLNIGGFRRGVRSRSRGGRDVHEMATIRRVVDQVRVRLAAGDGVRRGRIVRAASAPAPHPQHHILSAPGRLEVVYVFIDSRIIN